MPAIDSEAVTIALGTGNTIAADLIVPQKAEGLVVFAHGSGSSRFSARNRAVAKSLHTRGLATLVLDLLTDSEEAEDVRTAEYRFDIDLLGRRVIAATDWIGDREDLAHLPIGYFGASTGAAAALIAAAERPLTACAVVSRGGRPDLAASALPKVITPTLLIVGERDETVLELNEDARQRMKCAHVELEVIRGATHLFDEAGALHEVQRLAGAWFERHVFGMRS